MAIWIRNMPMKNVYEIVVKKGCDLTLSEKEAETERL